MSVATKTVAVLAATAVFVGLGSLGSTAFADAAAPATATAGGGQLGSTQGFHITNMTGDPLTLSHIDGSQLDSAPVVGSVLQPGQDADFEVRYVTGWDTDNIYYTNPQGRQVVVGIGVEGGTIPESSCLSSGPYDCSRPFFHQKYITITDPAGTVHEMSGASAQAEAAIVQQMCANDSQATCDFTPEGPVQKTSGPRHLVAWHENDGAETDEWKVATQDEVGQSNSFDISISAGTKFSAFGQKVEMEVKTTYGNEWSVSHKFDVSDTVEVEPGYTSYYYAVAPVLRYTGTVTVTFGQTTWKLHGVHFDTPDPDGAAGTSHNEAPNGLTPVDPPQHS